MFINQGKYLIFFFNPPFNIQCNIVIILGFQGGSLPSKYLGSPLVENALINISWEELLTKLEQKLSNEPLDSSLCLAKCF
jgi:hypothetical protein